MLEGSKQERSSHHESSDDTSSLGFASRASQFKSKIMSSIRGVESADLPMIAGNFKSDNNIPSTKEGLKYISKGNPLNQTADKSMEKVGKSK